jgi:pimeloyl-[acyl-carrier protein] synthase
MLLNLRDPAFARNPYPFYAMLHAQSPVLRQPMEHGEIVFLARHADVTSALKNPHVGHTDRSDALMLTSMPSSWRPLIALQRNWMLFLNPPRHTHLRSLVSKAFSPRAMDRLKGHVTQTAHRLLDQAMAKGESFDLVSDYACALPLATIAALIGVAQEDQHLLQRWAKDLARTLDMAPDGASMEQGATTAVEFERFLMNLIAERRIRPEEDLITALIAAEDGGATLSSAEMVATCVLLLVAGSETSESLVGNGVYAALLAYENWQGLVDNPLSIPAAVEEMLRYDSPVQMVLRLVLNDTEIAEQKLPRGTVLGLLIGAANRDPAVFDDPDRLNLQRNPNPHLAFSSGIHFCLGSVLARMEAQVALQVLCERMPHLTLANKQPLDFRGTTTVRGLQALPVKWAQANGQGARTESKSAVFSAN